MWVNSFTDLTSDEFKYYGGFLPNLDKDFYEVSFNYTTVEKNGKLVNLA